MTRKIEVPRDLLERFLKITDFFEDLNGVSMHDINEVKKEDGRIIEEFRSLLAAPEAPRQEPIYQVQYRGDGGGGWSDEDKDSYDMKVPHPKHWVTRIVYAAPLSPEHSGGAGEVVLPVVWRIPANGEWFYGTKEQCEREYAEYTADFTDEDFDEDGPAKPEPLAALDKVKELNQ